MAARIAMIAITTKSSIRVKPILRVVFLPADVAGNMELSFMMFLLVSLVAFHVIYDVVNYGGGTIASNIN
jgi:hypothetical protein